MKSLGLFLIFVLWTAFAVYSQMRPLKSFTNYGSCYQGLKSSATDKIVWEAEFESLFEIWDYDETVYPRNYFWKAEKNGSFGLLDPEGEIILPFEYSKISSIEAGFVASKGGNSFLFSNKGELLLELKSYDWFHPNEQGYIVEKNEKFGFLDKGLNIILPTEYDKLKFSMVQNWQEGRKEITSSRFIELSLNDKQGVFDLQAGKIVVPIVSKNLSYTWAALCSESDAIFHDYKFADNTIRIFNSQGVEIVHRPLNPKVHFNLTPTDSCGTKSVQLAYLEDNGKMSILNLKTGEKSSEYDEIFPMHGYSIFFNEKKWGVLDPELLELKQLPYPKYSDASLNGMSSSPRIHAAYERYRLLFSERYEPRVDSVLITRTSVEKKQGYDYFYGLYGLVNFRTGKRIKAKYSNVRQVQYEGATYYWATKREENEYDEGYQDETVELDIYNSELKLVREFKKNIGINYQRYAEKEAEHLAVTYNGKMGVINPRGEEIIPIKFDACHPREIVSTRNPSQGGVIFLARNENDKYTKIYSYDGKVLISKNYSRLSFYGEFIVGINDNGLSDFYNPEGELLMSDVEGFRIAALVNESGNCYDEKESFHKARPNAMYVIKKNYLHAYINNSFLRLDENYFNFTENYCFLHHMWLIDKSGKIVTLKPKGIRTRPKTYTSEYERLTECSTFIDEYPVPEKPVRKPKPVVTRKPAPVKPKPFVWKQKNTRNFDEWYLYNGNGLLLYPESFEYPMPVDGFYGGVFRQNGKFGFFDSKYNQFLPAEYDFIYPNYPITLKDGKWQLHDRNNLKVSAPFENVSIIHRPLHFVFEDGKIGALNDSLELEIPLTDSAEFIQKYDLVKLLNLRGSSPNHKYQILGKVIYNAEPREVYRMINNRAIIEDAYQNSTANHSLHFSPVDLYRRGLPYQLQNLEFFHNEVSKKVERRPQYYNRYFYAEMILSWDQHATSNYYPFSSPNDSYKNRKLFNYKIVGNKLSKISLKDVLKTDEASTKKLDEMMTKKLTKIQAFGDNCTDIASKLEHLKNNFLLTRDRIIFYWAERGGFEIELGYVELKGLIREPNKLKPL